MTRKIRDQEDAHRCLSAWATSGATLAAWARANQIDGRSLHCWKLNLGWVAQPRGLLELVPTSHESVSSARYRIRVDAVEIEVDDDFREETLARLLRVVVAC